MFYYNSIETQIYKAKAVDLMIARGKRIYILMIKVNKLIFLVFFKKIENMFSVFLSGYRNTCESLGELEKAVATHACGSCSHSISPPPKRSLSCFYYSIETRYMFSIS